MDVCMAIEKVHPYKMTMIFCTKCQFQMFIKLIFVKQSFKTWSRDNPVLTYLKNIAFDRQGCPNVLKGRVETWAKWIKKQILCL